MYQILVFFLLLIAWVIFSGFFDLFHLSLGVLSSLLVTWMSSQLLFADRTISMGNRARQAWLGVGYLRWLLWQIVLANIHILRLALSPTGPRDVRPSVVRFHTGL